jgi:hypothetical protein
MGASPEGGTLKASLCIDNNAENISLLRSFLLHIGNLFTIITSLRDYVWRGSTYVKLLRPMANS